METCLVEGRKNLKRNKIISTVRYHDQVSRHEVKKITGYSMTTVLNIIGELIEKKLLSEEDCTSVRTGRRPTWLHIVPDGLYAIGVEFNASLMTCVVVNFGYEVIYSKSYKITTSDSAEIIVGKICASVREALNFLGAKSEKVLGIGLGIPGYLDRNKGTVMEYAHIHALKNIPIRDRVQAELGLSVAIENNINAMALAYRWQTYQENAEDFVLLSMKHGTRMGIVLNNRVFTGNGNAGEIGHVKLAGGTRYCSCGQRGCLDTEVSFKAIRNKIIERMDCGQFATLYDLMGGETDKISMSTFSDFIERNDPDALSLLNEIAEYLGQALSMVLAALNPSRLIITSSSGMGGNLFSELVYEQLQKNTIPALMNNLSVKCIQVPDNMGAVGAAMLVLENEFQVIEENI